MRSSTKPNDANKLQTAVFTKFFFFFFLEIKIEILFDKREIHVKTHNNPVSIIQGNKDLFCRKQNMQQNKYSPWTYNTEIEIATDITITHL